VIEEKDTNLLSRDNKAPKKKIFKVIKRTRKIRTNEDEKFVHIVIVPFSN
jgi:hypothetical protein